MTLAAFAVDWYAARAAGVVAYLLVSASVALGLLMAGRQGLRGLAQVRGRGRPPLRRAARRGLHRAARLLARDRLAVAPDREARSSIPFTSSYRPFWTGLGIVAAELLLALAVTNHYRKRLRYSTWRRLHYLNFAVWAAATLHGLGAGTDSGSTAFLLMYAMTIGVVGVLAAQALLP